MKRIAVFCGSSKGFKKDYAEAAEELGEYFSKEGIGLVYGGGKIGIMGAIADTMIRNKAEVIGVIPGLLKHEEVAHAKISQMIVTRKMSKRKVRISKLVDGYIALPGGFGTLDEIFEALTLGQLGIERKAIGILNTNNFFKHIMLQLDHMVEEGFLKRENRDMIIINDNVPELIKKMQAYQAPAVKEVINKVASR